MSTPPPPTSPGGGEQPSEEEIAQLRAAYEAQMKQITVADIVVQTAVSLINLAGRRLGLTEDTRDERDLEQVRDAIDGVRGLMPVLERRAGTDLRALRDALGNLQMAYAREVQAGETAAAPGGAPEGEQPPPSGEEGDRRPGPAESSGRLRTPGQ